MRQRLWDPRSRLQEDDTSSPAEHLAAPYLRRRDEKNSVEHERNVEVKQSRGDAEQIGNHANKRFSRQMRSPPPSKIRELASRFFAPDKLRNSQRNAFAIPGVANLCQ